MNEPMSYMDECNIPVCFNLEKKYKQNDYQNKKYWVCLTLSDAYLQELYTLTLYFIKKYECVSTKREKENWYASSMEW